MIILKSSLLNAFILFDNNLVFGRSNTLFTFSQGTNQLFNIGSAQATSFVPMYVNNTLSVASAALFSTNVLVTSNLTVPKIYTSNVQINIPYSKDIRPVRQYFQTVDSGGNFIYTAYSDGSIDILGDANINNNANVKYDLVANTLTTNTWYNNAYLSDPTLVRTSPNYQRIQLSDLIYLTGETQITGNLHVYGDLQVTGKFQFNDVIAKYIQATSNMLSAQLQLSNISSPTNPTLYIDHDSRYKIMDVMNVKINTNYSSAKYNALRMDSAGNITIGVQPTNVTVPQLSGTIGGGLFNIAYSSSYGLPSNIATILSTSNQLVIDSNINIGIGTGLPRHNLHIEINSNMIHAPGALIGLYNYTQSNTIVTTPFISAFSNYKPIFKVGPSGDLTIGSIASDSNWNINVATNIKSPLIQTAQLVGYSTAGSGGTGASATCNISLQGTGISNVGFIYGSSMQMTKLTTMSVLVSDYFSASNFWIQGLNINSANGIFNVYQPTFWFTGTNICMSPNQADIQVDSTAEGQVKIYAPTPKVKGATSVGLNVFGSVNNSIRVTSTNQPAFEIFQQDANNNFVCKSFLGLDSYNTLYLGYQGATTSLSKPIEVRGSGLRIYDTIEIDTYGRMGINLGYAPNGLPNFSSYPLQVAGSTLIQTNGGAPSLYVDGTVGNVGIGVTNPYHTLHVQGDTYTTGMNYVTDMTTTGNVGFGTTQPIYPFHVNSSAIFTQPTYLMGTVGVSMVNPDVRYKIHINGDINIDGDIYQHNTINVRNPWGVNSGSLILTSNLGIGTDTPAGLLQVNGMTIFSGTSYTYPNHANIYTPQKLTSYTSNVNNVTFTLSASCMSNVLNAFDGSTKNNTTWRPYTNGYSAIDGTFIGTTSNNIVPATSQSLYSTVTNVDGNIYTGQWIQMYSSIPLYYNSVTMNVPSVLGIYPTPSSPTTFVIVASHDGVTWQLVQVPDDNVLGNPINWPSSAGQYKQFTINNNRAGYQYIRIIFTQIATDGFGDPTTNLTNYLEIGDMYFSVSPTAVYMNNGSIGIGTQYPHQSIDVLRGNIIVNSGNIGIGTQNPKTALHVVGNTLLMGNVGVGTTNPKFTFHVDGDLNFDGSLFQSGTKYVSSQWTACNLVALPTLPIYILNSVGIGTTTPKYSLHVQGSSYVTNPAIFNSNVTVNGTLYTRGNISSTSDLKIKRDLHIISEPLDKIAKLNGYNYNRIDTNTAESGLIAQELIAVMPELVNYNSVDDLLSISYGNMAGLFVEAIKKLHAKIERLEEKLGLKE